MNAHIWGAILYADGNWYVEEPREIPVLDRIGGGDGFVGGMLYACLKVRVEGQRPREALRHRHTYKRRLKLWPSLRISA